MITNLIIPIGGLGTRFSEAGYKIPKPLIPINGKAMILRAIESISMPFINLFIGLRKFEGYQELIEEVRATLKGNVFFYLFDEVTEGPAITVLDIINHFGINNNFLTINCDQIMNWDTRPLLTIIDSLRPKGLVVTFEGGDKRHSFVKTVDKKPFLFTEKIKVSDTALTGIHYFDSATTYKNALQRVISNNHKAPNGEYYISLLYNYIDKEDIIIYHIPKDNFYPVGTPDELNNYLNANI